MLRKSIYVSLIFLTVLSSCGGRRYRGVEKVYHDRVSFLASTITEQPPEEQIGGLPVADKEWIASVNFGIRKPNYVLIHHTAQTSTAQTVQTFQLERTQVSSHYVIGRDGKVIQMVNDHLRAHHAGAGRWGNDTDLNSSSIGIELDNNGTTDPWTDVQIDALLLLLSQLKEKYNIPQANFIGHMDYAPTRKIDPYLFPWKKLAENGFGFWYDEVLEPAPLDFDVRIALRVIGYDVRDLAAAIKAFKRHYIQTDLDIAELTVSDQAILYNIMSKYML